MGETCAMCGRIADPEGDGDPPLAWSVDLAEVRGASGTRWICPHCTREHVRSIEAKLDSAWW